MLRQAFFSYDLFPNLKSSGSSSVVELLPSKQVTRVRFPSPAPAPTRRNNACKRAAARASPCFPGRLSTREVRPPRSSNECYRALAGWILPTAVIECHKPTPCSASPSFRLVLTSPTVCGCMAAFTPSREQLILHVARHPRVRKPPLAHHFLTPFQWFTPIVKKAAVPGGGVAT